MTALFAAPSLLRLILVLSQFAVFSHSIVIRHGEFGVLLPVTGISAIEGSEQASAIRLAFRIVDGIVEYKSTAMIYDTQSTEDGALMAIRNAQTKINGVITGDFKNEVLAVMPIIQTTGLLHFTYCTSDDLEASEYNKFVRVVPSNQNQGVALADMVNHFGWGFTVATLSTSDTYGALILSNFLRRMIYLNQTVLASQEFRVSGKILWNIIKPIKESGARVIASFMGASDMTEVVRFAERMNMTTEKYVWFCSDACANSELYTSSSSQINENILNNVKGLIGTRLIGGEGSTYETFLNQWQMLDAFEFPGAGIRSIHFMTAYAFDAALAYFYAQSYLLNNSKTATVDNIHLGLRNFSFEGLSGQVTFDSTGSERIPSYAIVNLRQTDNPEEPYAFVQIGTWRSADENMTTTTLNFTNNPHFRNGSSILPNLDIRNSLTYWSCANSQQETNLSGKLRLDPPGPSANSIADHYRCDKFIDCYNMSDEWGYTTSLPIVFIIYGIAIVILMGFSLICIIFTIIFGFIIKRKRIRAASPTFLLIMAAASIVGYGGLFAFFGQPSTISCPFRIWLLALAIITMVAALFAKSFRIWRLYRSPTEIKAIRDWQLIIFVVICVLPVIIIMILWTALATPTAAMVKDKNGRYHYICTSGGVAKGAGTYVFFFLLVAYMAIYLLFGSFLSVVTRNVISTFNESRLIAIAIYNLVFLSVVAIPIVFVLRGGDPVTSWVVMVTAFLYAFSTTMALQFVPKMYGIILRDKFKERHTETTASGDSGSGAQHSRSRSKDSAAIW